MTDPKVTPADIVHEDSSYEIDLLKLVGKRVKAITGYLSMEFGYDPSFKLCQIVFEDGTSMGVEGEHDFPYVVEWRLEKQPNFNDETLHRLYAEINENEADE